MRCIARLSGVIRLGLSELFPEGGHLSVDLSAAVFEDRMKSVYRATGRS